MSSAALQIGRFVIRVMAYLPAHALKGCQMELAYTAFLVNKSKAPFLVSTTGKIW